MKAKSSAFCCSIGPETEVGGADVQKPLMESFLHLAICWLLDAFVLRVSFSRAFSAIADLFFRIVLRVLLGIPNAAATFHFFPPISTQWIRSTFSASNNARRCLAGAIASAVEAHNQSCHNMEKKKKCALSQPVGCWVATHEEKKPRCCDRIGSVRSHGIPMGGRASLVGLIPAAPNVSTILCRKESFGPRPRSL